MHNIVPTLARFQNNIPVVIQACYLCHQETRSLRHLLLHFPLVKLLWWNSSWNLKIETFREMQTEEWVLTILDLNNELPISATKKTKMLQFLVISFKQTWLEQNRVWKIGEKWDWTKSSSITNTHSLKYKNSLWKPEWSTANLPCTSKLNQWLPPLVGEFKLNFDAWRSCGIRIGPSGLTRHHFGSLD